MSRVYESWAGPFSPQSPPRELWIKFREPRKDEAERGIRAGSDGLEFVGFRSESYDRWVAPFVLAGDLREGLMFPNTVNWLRDRNAVLRPDSPTLDLNVHIIAAMSRVFDPNFLDRIEDELRKDPNVARVQRFVGFTPPAETAVDEAYLVSQDYRRKGPKGIDAEWREEKEKEISGKEADATGSTVKVALIEQVGYKFDYVDPTDDPTDDHEALIGATIVPDGGYSPTKNHGTNTLGVLVGQPVTEEELRGLCRSSTVYFFNLAMVDKDYYDEAIAEELAETTEETAVDGAEETSAEELDIDGDLSTHPLMILDKIIDTDLDDGDIVVVEASAGLAAPFEGYVGIHDLLWHWVNSRRLIVVEAAGNDGESLTAYSGAGGVWDVGGEDTGVLEDSDSTGAIIVGAGNRDAMHLRRSNSNYGPRVDCQGWGEGVGTSACKSALYGYSDYYGEYTDTSAATAVVGGLVAAFQDAFRKFHADSADEGESTSSGICPTCMRILVRDPLLGSPRVKDSAERLASELPYEKPCPDGTCLAKVRTDELRYSLHEEIGRLPDLYLLMRSQGIGPLYFMRDALDDAGTIPYEGTFAYKSPDIIVWNGEMTEAEFADAESSWDEDISRDASTAGDNYIYVRLENLGTLSDGGKVHLHWAYPGAMIAPAHWRYIGTEDIEPVEGGARALNPNPVVWKKDDLPEDDGHYCLIAVIDGTREPLLETALAQESVIDFARLVRNTRRVAWKNIKVVTPEEAASGFVLHLRGFGRPGRHDPYDFEFEPRLSRGAIVSLQPEPRDGAARAEATVDPRFDIPDGLPAARRTWIRGVHLADEVRRVRVRIHWPDSPGGGIGDVVVRQYLFGEVVGGFTIRVRKSSGAVLT